MSRTTVRATTPGFGAARRERERAQREEEILAAAERVISRHGFHGAGMTEIAREAEFAIGTLYGFFDSKEALYERLIVERTASLTTAMRAALEGGGSARECLERALDAKLAHMSEHLDFILIYASTSMMASCGWASPAAALTMREQTLAAVAQVARAAKSAGELVTDARPEDVALAFQTLSTGYLLAEARGPKAFDPERVRQAMHALFFEPLFGASAKPRSGAAPRRSAR